LKILDKYIIRNFLGTFFFMMAIIMLIACIFDLSEKIDDFMDRQAPISALITDYYFNFILYYGSLFAPLLIFISVIYFTSRLAARTEIVAMLSGGVSFKRLLVPYYIAGTLLTVIALFLNHYYIPIANQGRIAFEETYFKLAFQNYDKNIHKQITPNDFMYFEKYNAPNDIGYKFSLEHWEEGRLRFKLNSDYAEWDSTRQVWKVFNATKRWIDYDQERIEKHNQIDTFFGVWPQEFEKRLEYTTQMMNTLELERYIEKERAEGSEDLPFHLIEKHQRTSIPFASFVLVIIGVSISSRKVRGGIGAHLALGLFIAVVYIFIIKVFSVYATNAGLSPLLACWIPNILFAAMAVYLLRKAPK
jgi:lipopolysaccharide export system permease protein